MKNRQLARRSALSIGALLALLALAPQTPALSAAALLSSTISLADGEVKILQLGAGRSVIVNLAADASEIFVGEPKIANAVVREARRMFITTMAPGQTTIFALDGNGRRIAELDISVGLRDVGELATLLNTAIPGNDIHVSTVGDSIILTGTVASAGDAQKAVDISQGFIGQSNSGITSSRAQSVGNGAISTGSATIAGAGEQTTTVSAGSAGKVINSLIIRGLDQVSLRVTVSEIRREIIKQLGVNMSGGASSGSNFATQPPLSVNGPVSGALGATFAGQATLDWSMGGAKLSAQLAAFERQGVARTLAEPTVTAVSGESAKFLAGGTIPIVNGESCSGNVCTPTVIQQSYGVTLNFTPVVLSSGRIQLHVGTEVTDVDTSTEINILGAPVPGFRTRKNETTVELPSGGSIVTAGLISTKTQQAINGVPGLMNLPVLGALFRSRDYLRDETELLIVVTPYLVHAIDPRDVVRPDGNFAEASDPQAWLLGRVNRIYSTSGALQPMPGYSGKVGFITD